MGSNNSSGQQNQQKNQNQQQKPQNLQQQPKNTNSNNTNSNAKQNSQPIRLMGKNIFAEFVLNFFFKNLLFI